MRVLVTGSRTWDRPDVIETCLDILAAEAAGVGETRLVVVHGCARGADEHADRWVSKCGHPLDVTADRHPARWADEGRTAGILRNRRMVATRPDVVLAFIRDASPGAQHCASEAERNDIPVQYIDYADIAPPGGEVDR